MKAGNIEANPFGEAVLRTMSGLGYDAMTMGNREFHVLRPMLAAKIRDAQFPVLCANLRMKEDDGNNKSLPVQAFRRFEMGGVRVCVFGVTVPMVTERMAARHLSPVPV